MDNKYQASKIYKIINSEMPGLVYYGSTYRTLNDRMTEHKSSSKNKKCSSKALFVYGTPEIILIENYPCNNRKELCLREGQYHINNECINTRMAGRTDKEWYQSNKDIIHKQQKEYRDNNKEKLNEKFDCECGGKYTYQDKARHIKTKKHQAFISSN